MRHYGMPTFNSRLNTSSWFVSTTKSSHGNTCSTVEFWDLVNAFSVTLIWKQLNTYLALVPSFNILLNLYVVVLIVVGHGSVLILQITFITGSRNFYYLLKSHWSWYGKPRRPETSKCFRTFLCYNHILFPRSVHTQCFLLYLWKILCTWVYVLLQIIC